MQLCAVELFLHELRAERHSTDDRQIARQHEGQQLGPPRPELVHQQRGDAREPDLGRVP